MSLTRTKFNLLERINTAWSWVTRVGKYFSSYGDNHVLINKIPIISPHGGGATPEGGELILSGPSSLSKSDWSIDCYDRGLRLYPRPESGVLTHVDIFNAKEKGADDYIHLNVGMSEDVNLVSHRFIDAPPTFSCLGQSYIKPIGMQYGTDGLYLGNVHHLRAAGEVGPAYATASDGIFGAPNLHLSAEQNITLNINTDNTGVEPNSIKIKRPNKGTNVTEDLWTIGTFTPDGGTNYFPVIEPGEFSYSSVRPTGWGLATLASEDIWASLSIGAGKTIAGSQPLSAISNNGTGGALWLNDTNQPDGSTTASIEAISGGGLLINNNVDSMVLDSVGHIEYKSDTDNTLGGHHEFFVSGVSVARIGSDYTMYNNNLELRWKDNAGTQRPVLKADSSNQVILGDISWGSTYIESGSNIYLDSGGGVVVGAPTGGSRGTGTINAHAVYDDSTLLTCYVFEQANTGVITEELWDSKVPNRIKKEKDEEGNDVEIEEVRIHEPMRKFRARLGTEYDPLDIDKYSQHWKDKGHLTSMPNEEKYVQEGIGSWLQKLVETVELQAVHIDKLNQRVKALEGLGNNP